VTSVGRLVPFGIVSLIVGADAPATGGGSQQPAVIALVIGIISAVAAAYNIVQQMRAQKVSEKAAANSAASDASKTSFEQIMATTKWQGEQVTVLRADLAAMETRADAAEKALEVERRRTEALTVEVATLRAACQGDNE